VAEHQRHQLVVAEGGAARALELLARAIRPGGTSIIVRCLQGGGSRRNAALYWPPMFVRRAAVILIGIAALSCSEPPTKERNQADGAIAAALAADAATYAPDELQTAQAALAKYDDAVASRDYRLALNTRH
jgi:hypothetical protein